MAEKAYPLAQVLQVKQKRVEDAENLVKEKIEALKKEEEALNKKKEERDKVKVHYQDKLTQMRALMDEGTTSPKIQQMKVYLKVVKDKLIIEDKKVTDQQALVDTAEKSLEEAKAALKIKRQEVDKFLEHRKSWIKEMRQEQEIIEGREQDELGSMIFTVRHRKK